MDYQIPYYGKSEIDLEWLCIPTNTSFRNQTNGSYKLIRFLRYISYDSFNKQMAGKR